MKTAVEWFWLNLTDDLIGDLAPKKILKIYELIEQAKAMEKEQNYNLDNLRDAYRWGTTVSIGSSDHFEEFLHNIKTK